LQVVNLTCNRYLQTIHLETASLHLKVGALYPDLHSVCADLVYGEEWINSAEDDCSYMERKAKCNCPKHKTLRTNVKTINFGLAYGMGPHKLADTLDISTKDAEKLIEKYFAAFPAIGGFLDKLGSFGKTYGYIKTFNGTRLYRACV